MKMRRLVSVLLSLCIVLGIVSNSISATETVASGSCGDNLIWVLDSQGTLTIQGQGEMWDWAHITPPYSAAYSTAPWYTYCNDIKEVVIQEGVTSIGYCAFLYCTNLSVVKIPEGVTNIEMSAFEACRSLRAINIPSTVTYVSAGTFKCTGLREIVLPRNLSFLGASAFYGCTDLQNVYFLGDAPQLGYFPENTFAECSKDLTIYYVPSKSGWTGSAWKTYTLDTWEGYEEENQFTDSFVENEENFSNTSDVPQFNQDTFLDIAKHTERTWHFIAPDKCNFETMPVSQIIDEIILAWPYFGASFYYYYEFEPYIRTDDPKQMFNGYCLEFDVDSVHWILENIFGRQADYASGEYHYYYNDKLYVRDPLGIGDSYDLNSINIQKCTPLENNEYEIFIKADFSDWFGDISPQAYTYRFVTAVQTISGTNYYQLKEFERIIYAEENIGSVEEDKDSEVFPEICEKSFNEYFVENKKDNVQELLEYESVARVVCEESSNAEIYWNAYLSALSDSEFLSVDNIGDASASPLKMHHYYEAALLEAIMQTKLENDYLSAIGERALKTAVEAASFCVQYNSEFESREDVLKRKLKEETRDLDRDGEEIIKIYEYYGKKCKDLETYDVVKSIYDLCIETKATVEEFHQALSNYVEVKQAGDEVLAALEYLKGYLELSNDKEDKIILTAVENVITSMTITLDTQLVYNVLESMQDQFWNMMIGMAEDLLGEYFLVAKAATMCIDGGLLLMDVLFPTTTSSKSYCKLYADFAIEWVVQDAVYAAYDEYRVYPRKEMADAIIGLYDILTYTYQHEIRVGGILVEQLHKDGLLNGLRNLVSSSNMEDYRYEKACIQSYDAYLAEITKEKVETQREYGIAIGKLQPVYIVYFINGKALLFEEFTTETGVPYIAPVERAEKVANALGFKADVMGVYLDSTMKKAYDDTVPVYGPVTLFMDIGLYYKKDGTPALVDPATRVSVTKTSLPRDTRMNVTQEVEGNTYTAATAHFEGKNIEVYDISLSAEKGEVQPSGDVTVSIPLRAGHEEDDVFVYYMDPNGAYEDMEAMVEDGYCKFNTTHFSKYVIVYESSHALNNLTIAIIIASTAVVSALVVLLVIIRARRTKRKS